MYASFVCVLCMCEFRPKCASTCVIVFARIEGPNVCQFRVWFLCLCELRAQNVCQCCVCVLCLCTFTAQMYVSFVCVRCVCVH